MNEHGKADERLIEYLRSRDGSLTILRDTDGISHRVFNIAWGYDFGDQFAHVTTNISPGVDGEEPSFFFTNEIVEATGADGRPHARINCSATEMKIDWT